MKVFALLALSLAKYIDKHEGKRAKIPLMSFYPRIWLAGYGHSGNTP